ncbi:MAG: cupin domain-containing protein [Bacteroidales bacterium]|nr:cupin domain-containing protein [Bacteroidales bacterium]
MQIINIDNAPKRQNPFNADVRVLFNRDDLDILQLQLEPGKMLSKVTIENDAFFFILEGKPEVSVGDETEFVSEGNLVFCPGGKSHCISNPNDSLARIFIVKLL